MQRAQFDPEILYVEKIFYFMFLTTLTAITSAIVLWLFGLNYGLLFLGGGLLISYIAMLKKRTSTLLKKN